MPSRLQQLPRRGERFRVASPYRRAPPATGRRSTARNPRRCLRPASFPLRPAGAFSTTSLRIEPAGSARTISVAGERLAKKRLRPVSVPPEPTPQTIASTLPSSWAKISGPVAGLVGERIGRIDELVDVDRARRLRGERARPCPGNIPGWPLPTSERVRTTSAPIARRWRIFSRLILSGMTRMQPVALGAPTSASPRPVLPAVASTMTPPGFSRPVPLGRLDHRQRRTVLDRAAGIGAFELEKQAAPAGVELGDLDDRRLADQR